MAYTKQTWSDLPSKTTPINASRLGHIEQGIYDAAATADNASTAISAMGTAVSKNSTNAVTQNSTDLVESGAVYTAIANAKASCYKPSGDKTCAELVAGLLVQANLGNVYNITDSGTTTSDFVGGAGKPISVGDNVAIVDVGSSVYKFDLLSGMVDLSNYQTKALSAQVEGQSTVEGALGALSNANQATRQLIDDTVGWTAETLVDGLNTNHVINASGVESENNEFDATDYILVEPRCGYVFEGYHNVATQSAQNIRVHGYNASGTWVEQITYLGVTAKGDFTIPIKIDDGIAKVRISIPHTIDDYKFRRVDVDEQKCDNTVIAPVENGATCANPNGYKVGEHFQKNGKFCTCIANTAQGATWTLNTNYVEGNIADYLTLKKGTITPSTGITLNSNARLLKQGRIVYIDGIFNGVSATVNTDTILGSIPDEYRPPHTVNVAGITSDALYPVRITIGAIGDIILYSASDLSNKTVHFNMAYDVSVSRI